VSAGAAHAAGLRGVLVFGSLVLCLVGVGKLTQGLAVPVEAQMAQHRLEQTFEQRLAASREASSDTRGGWGMPAARSASPSSATFKASDMPVDGPIARLSIERIGVRDIVLAGQATHDQLARGPTMLKRGDATNPVTILAAHRDTHFLFIRDLHEGDEVDLQWVDGKTERYRIVRFETVRWDKFIYPLDVARPLLALTTCYPFGGTEYGGPWRRVAWGERIA
jgi:sortase A